MKPFGALGLFLVLAVATQAKDPAVIQWQNFSSGIQDAKSEGKYVFVDVYADWCEYCKKLDAVTFRAPPVITALDQRFVSVRLNADGNESVVWKGQKMTAKDLVAMWGVEGLPTLLFMNPKGELIGSFSSYAEPDLMVKLLAYISSGARERKVSFDDFIKGAG